MLEDLTMLATLPVDQSAVKKAEDEAELDHVIDKAAAAETMPEPKDPSEDPADDTAAGRIARRGQDPPEREKDEI
jgi:hypothetical protein